MLLLLALGTLIFVSEEEEFGDLVPGRPLRLAMFSALFLVYGAVIGLVGRAAERRLVASAWAFGLLALLALGGAGLIAVGLVFFAAQLAQRPETLLARLLVWAAALGLAAMLLAARKLSRRD